MAGRGPLPKDHHQRERDTKRRQADSVTVEADGLLRGPDLAEATGREDWHERTLAWYRRWQSSPQSQLFQETDWSRLVMLADLVDEHHKATKKSAATFSEIRLNEASLGATYADRRRERIVVSASDEGASERSAGEVVSINVARDSIASRMRRPAQAAPPAEAEEPTF